MASKTYEANTRYRGGWTQSPAIMRIPQPTLWDWRKVNFATSTFKPKFRYTTGKSVFDTSTFDVRRGGLSSTQQIDFGSDEYFRFSFTPEFGTVLGDPVNLLRPYGFNHVALKPKVFCEKYDYETSRKCGQGLGVTLQSSSNLQF